MQKRTRKLVDLVCTKAAKYPTSVKKCAAQLLGQLFVTLWTCGKHGQMQSNEAKRKGLLLMNGRQHFDFWSNSIGDAFLTLKRKIYQEFSQ